ncbi:MAG: DUF2779 domain-containing protein [Candidatus Margulisbacteria bacterium]|nr:DUF2779 domain-containing protein [Candidatus Margulisiibacteriota bacterium]
MIESNKLYPLSVPLFVRGNLCHKSLWLHQHRPELSGQVDETLRARFDEGYRVGLFARELFLDGRCITEEADTVDRQLWLTKKLMNSSVMTLYEPAFKFDSVLIFPNILCRTETGWTLYDVKSHGMLHPGILKDVALQYFVLKGLNIQVDRICVVHINTDYVLGKSLDVLRLFTVVDVTDRVKMRLNQTRDTVQTMQRVLASSVVPKVAIGPHCSKPYECDFKPFCWQHLSDDSVFSISGLSKNQKFTLYEQGVREMQDMPASYPLSDEQVAQVRAHREGVPTVNLIGLRDFLGTLHYPLCFLDFEAFQSAIPLFSGTRPYEQIPFQFSLHIQSGPTAEPINYSFLASESEDPRRAFAESLIKLVPENGCIVTYDHHLESQAMRHLAVLFPDLSRALLKLVGQIRDLIIPFEKGYLYSPAMRGRYSIKTILPAFVPELSYENLVIKNGEMAALSFCKLRLSSDAKEKSDIRIALEKYCEMDTYAMVRLLDVLRVFSDRD